VYNKNTQVVNVLEYCLWSSRMDWNSLQIVVNILLQQLVPWLNLPMKFFTFLGTEEFFLLVMPALYWCYSPTLGIRTALVLLFSNSFNASLKMLFHAPRPYWINPHIKALATEISFGLPSNHAQTAAALWGYLGVSIRKARYWVPAVLVAFFIGFSRLYLGVHFLGDVLLGWAIGGVFCLILIRLDRPVSAWLSRQSLRALLAWSALSSLALVLLVVVPGETLKTWPLPPAWLANASAAAPMVTLTPYSVEGGFSLGGVWFGMMTGAAWLTRRGGGFQVDGTALQRLQRYLIGLTGVMLLWFGLGQLFPRSPDWIGFSLRFIRYALLGLWISCLAPLFFRRLRLYA
jgi:membrane-associated phospholipid phosphatase